MSSLDDFLVKAWNAAISSGHIFPDWAACEAALESAWGTSRLCIEGCNLFGEKQHHIPIYDTLTFSTTEYEHGVPVTVKADFIKFPDWATSFKSRMDTLRRLAPDYPDYQRALDAPDGNTFVREVSNKWSTDPLRAQKVIQIHTAHACVFIHPSDPPVVFALDTDE